MKGWVYIAVNKSLPGQVKIGYSDRHPDHRMQELSNTSVPTPFMCAYAALCDDPFLLEQLLHGHLDDCRVSPDREFFYLSPEVALTELVELAQSRDIEITHSERNESLLPDEEEDPHRLTRDREIHKAVETALSKIQNRILELKKEAKSASNPDLHEDLVDIEVAYKNWRSENLDSWLQGFTDNRPKASEVDSLASELITNHAKKSFEWFGRIMSFVDVSRFATIPRGQVRKFRAQIQDIRERLDDAANRINARFTEIARRAREEGNHSLLADVEGRHKHYLEWCDSYLNTVQTISLEQDNTLGIFRFFEKAAYEECGIGINLWIVDTKRHTHLGTSKTSRNIKPVESKKRANWFPS